MPFGRTTPRIITPTPFEVGEPVSIRYNDGNLRPGVVTEALPTDDIGPLKWFDGQDVPGTVWRIEVESFYAVDGQVRTSIAKVYVHSRDQFDLVPRVR